MRLDRSRPIFVEKSPPNTARTRWLQHHFENAHFIGIVRDGYAVSEGIRRKAEPSHMREGWPISACAHQWARSYEVLLEDAEHLDRLIWVRYEDLAEDTTDTLARIGSFLGIGETAFETDGEWAVHERRQPIRNLNEASLDRLSDEDRRVITEVAGPMLEHFGYPLRSG